MRSIAGASGGRAKYSSTASAKQVLASAKQVPYRREEKRKEKKDIAPAGAVSLPPEENPWLERAKGVWPKQNYDGSAVPRSSSVEVEKRFVRITKSKEASGEELALCAFLFTETMKTDKHYVCSLETFLGPKKVWLDYLQSARNHIARKAVNQ